MFPEALQNVLSGLMDEFTPAPEPEPNGPAVGTQATTAINEAASAVATNPVAAVTAPASVPAAVRVAPGSGGQNAPSTQGIVGAALSGFGVPPVAASLINTVGSIAGGLLGGDVGNVLGSLFGPRR